MAELGQKYVPSMFTGIIECMGSVEKKESNGTNISFWISSPLASALKVDQSLAHDGVCLTVEAIDSELHCVTAVSETLQKTCLGDWEPGKIINLERAMVLGGRLDGHLVQGHVDATGTCLSVQNQQGSWLYRFSFPSSFAALVIEKGSICINGISLTAFQVGKDSFSVAIIPYTYEHTNIKEVKTGSTVNIEFDILGKYIARKQEL
jgi:riboflavin synthase